MTSLMMPETTTMSRVNGRSRKSSRTTLDSCRLPGRTSPQARSIPHLLLIIPDCRSRITRWKWFTDATLYNQPLHSTLRAHGRTQLDNMPNSGDHSVRAGLPSDMKVLPAEGERVSCTIVLDFYARKACVEVAITSPVSKQVEPVALV